MHGQKLDDAVFDLLKPVMIGIKDFARHLDILFQAAGFLPRHGQHPVKIVADDCRLGAHRPHILQLAQLSIGFFARGLRHFQRGKRLFQLFQFAAAIFTVAKLFLDRLHLFVQVIFALRLFHLPLDAVAYPLFNLQRANFVFHQLEDLLQTLMHVQKLQQLLLFRYFDGQVRRDHIGDLVSFLDLLDSAQNL